MPERKKSVRWLSEKSREEGKSCLLFPREGDGGQRLIMAVCVSGAGLGGYLQVSCESIKKKPSVNGCKSMSSLSWERDVQNDSHIPHTAHPVTQIQVSKNRYRHLTFTFTMHY